MRKLSQAGLDLIKSFEGLKLEPYLDSIGKPTIGYGTILYEDGTSVTMDDAPISQAKAEQLLEWQVEQKCSSIEEHITAKVNDNEFAALISFAYNLGVSALEGSTLLKLLNAGTDRSAVADQFLRWDRAGGQQVPGLTRRRQAERSLFLQPVVQSDDTSQDDVDSKLQSIEDDIMKN